LRLLWWTLVTPQQLKAYREEFGKKAEGPTGKWLVSTLIWLPFFLPFSAVGFEIVPFSPYTFPSGITLTSTHYLWASGGLFIAWLLTGVFGNNKAAFTVEQLGGFLLGLSIGVLPVGLAGFLALGPTGFVSVGLAGGLALGLARGRVVPLAGTLMLGLMFGLGAGLWLGLSVELGGEQVLELVEFKLVLVLVLVLAIGLPIGLEKPVQKSLETGRASWVARGAFGLLVAANAFLVWYSYLGGWRVF
jgi:hypothetical protein